MIRAIWTFLNPPNKPWEHAPFSNTMRRKVNGQWQHRPKTEGEETDYEAASAW